ncbi:MAG: HAMP domain-containing histidine kinase, partial [Cellulomonadaceae bacterium]|nr:HAMP domain-containing histidine kinase [Cellulomonadaceae bacterium]
LDAQLANVAPNLLQEALHDGGREQVDDSALPSDYYAVFASTTGEAIRTLTAPNTTSTPDLPSLTSDEVVALAGQAFTVDAAEGGTHWRVLIRPVTVNSSTTVVASIAVALPMDASEATLRQMTIALVAISSAVVALGAAAGWWGVRAALQPLHQIEDTAAAIAAGDLSRRVPGSPPSTEVGRLAVALNGMLTQIEQAFAVQTASEERMRRFVADASHELRTPLATIRGYGELYRMGAMTTTDEVDGAVKRIEDSATRRGTLVEDLLHLARLDEGRPQRNEPVDLLVLAGDAAADLRALDADRPVRLEPLVPGGSTAGAVAMGDDARLRQVVGNLVGNVVQHTPQGTPVEIVVGRLVDDDGAHAVIEVRDHGPGIAPEHAARVFERFYRVDAARGRETGGGAGLGMAIVAAITQAHGGRIDLRQTPGGGTTVRVSLPAADA